MALDEGREVVVEFFLDEENLLICGKARIDLKMILNLTYCEDI